MSIEVKISKARTQEIFDLCKVKAERLLDKEGAVEKICRECELWLKEVPGVGDDLKNIPVFISMVRAYLTKEYTDSSRAVIVKIVATILYCVSPLDIIPDAFPAGYVDDGGFVALCYLKVKPDVEKYLAWRDGESA